MKNALLVLVSVVFSLILIEGIMRVVSPVELRLMGNKILLPYFKKYEIKVPNPRVLEPHVTHVKNNLGFRGPNPPTDLENMLSIIAVGGSTTESFVLGDGMDWPAVLARKLDRNFHDIWMNNAGINGHTTYGHIMLLEQHVLQMKPKVILFLVGVNDANFDENFTRFDPRILPEYEEDAGTRVYRSVRDWLAAKSHLGAWLYQLYKQLKAENLYGFEVDFWSAKPSDFSPAQRRALEEELRNNNYFGFESRVRKLIELSRASGVVPIFATQSSLAGPGADRVTGLDLSQFEGRLAYATRLVNKELIRIGKETGVLVVDLASAMPKSTDFFYDFWHYTNEGAEVAAGILYREICGYLQKRFPRFVKEPCVLPVSDLNVSAANP